MIKSVHLSMVSVKLFMILANFCCRGPLKSRSRPDFLTIPVNFHNHEELFGQGAFKVVVDFDDQGDFFDHDHFPRFCTIFGHDFYFLRALFF